MQNEYLFYIDDSGSRELDRRPGPDNGAPDWFGFGGLLVAKADKDLVDTAITEFKSRWPQIGTAPLRSYDIRNRKNGFKWLGSMDEADMQRFHTELSDLILSLPIVVLACVIDRPGYNKRYADRYGPRRWKLCKTAFSIVLERAAKFAVHHGSRLRIYVERCDPQTERQLKHYYEDLRTVGQPFNPTTSAKYAPLSPEVIRKTLFEYRVKTKASSLMQLADVVLFPTCKGGYEQSYRPYQELRNAGKLIDVHCTDKNGLQGIKYSCFDTVETQKPA